MDDFIRTSALLGAADRKEAARCSRQADDQGLLRKKYEWASRRPWLSVAPDPPMAYGDAMPATYVSPAMPRQLERALVPWIPVAISGYLTARLVLLALCKVRQLWQTPLTL